MDKTLTEYALRDHALAAGLASQPIGWKSSASLGRFPPASVYDHHGNQIFYLGSRSGFSAEAYVRAFDGKFSRFKISSGKYPYGIKTTQGRVYNIVRIASLTPTGSFRVCMIQTSQQPVASTIAVALPDNIIATRRVVMSLGANGFVKGTPFSIVHTNDWQNHLSMKDREQAEQANSFDKLFNKSSEEGFSKFEVLIKNLIGCFKTYSSSVDNDREDGHDKMVPQNGGPKAVSRDFSAQDFGCGVVGIIMTGVGLAAMTTPITFIVGGIIIAGTVALCSQGSFSFPGDNSPLPPDPFWPVYAGDSGDPSNVSSDPTDDGDGGGGDPVGIGRGPLPKEMTGDGSSGGTGAA